MLTAEEVVVVVVGAAMLPSPLAGRHEGEGLDPAALTGHTPRQRSLAVGVEVAPHTGATLADGTRGPVARTSRWASNDRWRPAMLVAALVVALSCALLAAYRWLAPDARLRAAHYARLGRAILREEPGGTRANRDALALFDKALAHIDLAAAAVDRALRLEPGNATGLRVKGVVLRSRRDPEGAVAVFRQALALNPTAAWTHAQLGRARIDLGQADLALADIEKAIALAPSEPARHIWHDWAGMAALHAGKDEVALAWLLKARLPRGSYYRFAFLQLAVAYALLGREAEGRETLAVYRARWPALSLAGLEHDLRAHNPTVSAQRERILAAVRRLGVPEGPVRAARF